MKWRDVMLANKLHSALPDIIIEEKKSLSPLCTLKVGGEAEIFVAPNTIEDMKNLFAFALNEGCPVYVLGGGSNVIFPDGLVKGIVISTLNLKSFVWRTEITADIDAGVMLPLIMKELREKNLGGMEFAAGIPGTLGGALAGNAGAGGQGVCELVDDVICVEDNGEIKTWHNSELKYSYRKSSLADKKRIILSARMTFRKSNPKDKNLLESFLLRRGTQPHAFGNAGCTFKNPETTEKSAGQLLDECGCKNLSVGDAIVSEKHANFILNRGNATSSDVIGLIKICAQKVYENTGIKLEPEIKIF